MDITTIFWMVVMSLLFLSSCNKDKGEVVEVVFDPETTYTMRTTDAISLISDSGITRYRITAKEMLIFDDAKDPYLYFPQGVYAEQFDTLLNVQASIKADTVYNWTKKNLWKLIGNVEIENLEGERFETDTLYWDRTEGRVYSDAYMRIQREGRIIMGTGFESNQNMTHYRIYKPQGSFPVSESTSSDDNAKKQDGEEVALPVTPARNRTPIEQQQPQQLQMIPKTTSQDENMKIELEELERELTPTQL